MEILRLRGVSYRMHWGVFLVGALFIAAGRGEEILLTALSVVLHEGAHAAAARAFGYAIEAVELLPFGGVARLAHAGEFSWRKNFLIAAAGPLCSVLLGLSGMALWHGGDVLAGRTFAFVNAVLAGFNLLPAFPLDGGQMCRAVLTASFSYDKATRYTVACSRALGVALTGKAAADIFCFATINFTVVAAAFFVLRAARREAAAASFYRLHAAAAKKSNFLRHGYLAGRLLVAQQNMLVKNFLHDFRPEGCAIVCVVDGRQHVVGMFTEFEIWEAIVEKGIAVRFEELLS